MKIRTLAMMAVVVLGGIVQAQDIKQTLFSDTFPGNSRNDTKWRDSIFLESTANMRVLDNRVLLTRNTNTLNSFQQTQWDSKFVRLYDGNDYLQIGARVRIPHKVRSGSGAYMLGIGLISGFGEQFAELLVEDSVNGRAFVLFIEDTATSFTDFIVYDAPQNVNVFDIVVTYSARNDALAFYWSIPGVNKLFRIGEILNFSTAIGGTAPRRLRPYIIGVIEEDAAVPPRWNVSLDDFFAYREDAP